MSKDKRHWKIQHIDIICHMASALPALTTLISHPDLPKDLPEELADLAGVQDILLLDEKYVEGLFLLSRSIDEMISGLPEGWGQKDEDN